MIETKQKELNERFDMKIWCNNDSCNFIHLLEKPYIRTKKGLIELLFPESYCGTCIGKPQINSLDFKSSKVELKYGICVDSEIDEVRCNKIGCLYNDEKYKLSGNCLKDELFIANIKLRGEEFWICKCFSDRKISGHKDWMSLIDSSGHPYGGSIDDEYSEKLNHDNKVTRSFPDHTRQEKEERRKR